VKRFIFTFGSAHLDANGGSLGRCFCAIEAEDANEARAKMNEARSNVWAFHYETPEQAEVEKYDLREVSLDSVRIAVGACGDCRARTQNGYCNSCGEYK
jgi:hypothetical protein